MLYAGQTLLPTLTPGVGYGARRLQSAFEETPSYYGEAPQSRTAAVLQVLGGQKTVAIDAKTEAEKRRRELRRDLFDIDAQVRAVKRNQYSLHASVPYPLRFASWTRKRFPL